MTNENIYWLFSASAQCIAAFVAFIITGFALMHTIIDRSHKNDDTLIEIYDELKIKNYNQIKILSFLTGSAIILSLFMLYLNGIKIQFKEILFIFTFTINIAVVLIGLIFVVSIINPNKYGSSEF